MFKRLKEKISRALASVLAIVMILTLIPVGTFVTVFAATTEYPDSLTIKVSDAEGAAAGAEVKFVSKSEEFTKTEITDKNGVIAIDGAELEAYLGENEEDFTITIIKDGYKIKSETVTLDKSKSKENFNYVIEKIPAIEGVNVTPYVGKYDEKMHCAVEVTGAQKGDNITYSTDGGASFSTKEPTVENPGDSEKVIVKVERTDYLTFISDEVTASVSKGEIGGIVVTPYKGSYDYGEHAAIVDVKGARKSDIISYSTDDVNYSSSVPNIKFPGSLTVYVKIVRNDKYEEYKQSFEASVVNAAIQDVVVKPYIGEYDKEEHEAVIVEGAKEDDDITFSTDGINYSKVNPPIKDVGTLDVYVKIRRAYHDDLPTPPAELKVTAVVSQSKIEGVTATGYSAKYDKEGHEAVTSFTGIIEGDVVTYSNRESGPYTSIVPIVKYVNDSGTYYFKVHRNDNYEDLIIPVTVSITKNDQTIKFGTTSDITYNTANTFKYEIAEKSADDSEGEITYKIIGGTAEASINEENGTVTYNSIGTVKVKADIAACDNYEAASTQYEITIKYIDTPEFSITPSNYTDSNSLKWHNSDVVISAADWTVVEGTNAVDAAGWAESITKTDENIYDFTVSFKDEYGNITNLVSIDKFAIDKTSPTEKNKVSVEIKDKYDSVIAKVINFLSFGLFCNEAVEIKVNADDEALTDGSPSSGIQSIQMFMYPVSGDSEEVELNAGKKDTFTIGLGFEGTLKVLITDNAGNTLGEQLITNDNSNMTDASGYMMLEEVAPIVSELVDTPLANVRRQEGTHNYSGDAEIKFSVQDTGSGLYSVAVKLNGAAYPKALSPVIFNRQDRDLHDYTLSTEGIEPDENGKYAFVVTVTDNAGNVAEKTLKLEKDLTSPTIIGFDFSLTADNSNVSVEDCVTVEDYGYYFKEGVSIKVSAKDEKAEEDHETVSGVRSITVVLLDKDGRYYTVNTEGNVVAIDNISEAVAHANLTDDAFTFDIVENFKGQVFAFAADNVGNTPMNSAFDLAEDVKEDGILKGYKFPNGSVLESAAKHADTSSIEIAAPENTASQNEIYAYTYSGAAKKDKVMDYNVTQKVPLYKSNPTFNLTVKDEYSGIREIKVTVIENGISTVKTLIIDNRGEKTGDDADAWTITREAGTNLAAVAARSIEVNGNFNNMVILVELTDRAGNSSYDYYIFGIDKTNPTIIVEMNDDDFDKYKGFFKADRTAAFTIKERNYQDGLVTFNVTMTDDNGVKKDVAVTPEFDVEKDGNGAKSYIENGHEYYVYTMKYTFTEDGDYTFDIKVKDLAANDNDAVSYVNADNEDIQAISTEFTIDKTLPTVSVVYDNNNAMNGNYYKADRIATITVAEHNFVADDIVIAAVSNATHDGKPSAFPTVSPWKDNGNNTHTATISYTADSKYTFDIEFLDKSGNSIANYTPDEFCIDKTAPSLEITGIADKKSYPGEVVPIITYSDVNFNENAVSIVLTGINNGTVNYSGAYKDIAHGQQYAYANFEKEKKVDDIYTLTAKLTDMAGNETEKTISFSVNRFGSVYDLSKVEHIINKYLQNENDIVFTETNVSGLEREGIIVKLTKNGTPTDLAEGTDYTVEVSGGNGQWSVYTYTINKKLFADDGIYSISVYSKDDAGNINENIDEAKEAEISFGIDKTKPVIVPIDFESGVQYAAETKTVSVEIKDNLVLESVKIYLNGKEIEYKAEDETYKFDIPESNNKQDVKIAAADAAGNEESVEISEFLVTTSIFVRWYNNTPLFIGSIIGVIVVALGAAALILFGKKRKE
ncbi:MAG TPA: hypothetical protein DD413_04155 [Ruminococcus sp.]|nr:hypothetical protein [Ruminococcus sp.]